MQLYGLRMERGTKIQDHLRKLDELSDQLATIGEEVKEVHKVYEAYKRAMQHSLRHF